MKTKDKRLKAVDDEYVAAFAEFKSARNRLKEAAEARTAAHLAVEWERSAEAKRAANMSDDEYAALLQRLETVRGPKVEPTAHTPN